MSGVGSCFELMVFPAGHGDCLWLEYEKGGITRRALFDGGPSSAFDAVRSRILSLPVDQRHFELLVITHIDADHIGGVLKLLEDEALGVTFGDVWFNGFDQLEGPMPMLGVAQGERLSEIIVKRNLPWNLAFNGKAVRLGDSGEPVCVTLAGGLRLTLLSPGPEQLMELKPIWKSECEKAGLFPGVPAVAPEVAPMMFGAPGPVDVEALAVAPFDEDGSVTNASSIGLLVEFGGKRALLSGDAHPSVLRAGVEKLRVNGERLKLDVFKLPHHGSKHNIDRVFLDSIECGRYIFSSNGAYFHHPDREASARVIKYGGAGPKLLFNYKTQFNDVWDDEGLRSAYGYSTEYGDGAAPSIVKVI